MAAAQTIQMLGLIGAASYLTARLVAASRAGAFHRYAILAQPRASLPMMPRGFRVEALGAAALAGHAIDASPAVQAQRFAEGLTCLGVFDPKDRLTGVIWLRIGAHLEDEVAVRFHIPVRCCWDTGLWIAPQFRLGRSFAALWAGVGAWMDAQGVDHSLSRVADYNLPSLLAHKRMGARVLAHHSFIRIGDWQWSNSTRPRLVRLSREQGAELDLRGLIGGDQAASVSAS